MPSTWTIRGHGGRLRCGARTVATLARWQADSMEGERFRLRVEQSDRDPIGWDNHDPDRLIVELRLTTSDWRGRARIVSAEPLVAEIWRDDTDA